MKKNITFIFALLTIVLTSFALADIRVATVDVNRVLNESKEGKAKRAHIDELSQTAKKKIETKKNSLKAVEEKLKSSGATETSSEAKEFKNQVRELQIFAKDTEDELRQEFLKVNKSLTEKVVKSIESYAGDNKIDLVLDKSAQERGAVLFGNDSADITSDIIKSLNK